jgi:hypothetical protein
VAGSRVAPAWGCHRRPAFVRRSDKRSSGR